MRKHRMPEENSRVPRIFRPVIRSILTGISAAGVVNTVAPGLFPTCMGYLAGSLRGTGFSDTMVRLGLFSLGAFSTPTISGYGILAAGAVIGLLTGLILMPVWHVGSGIVRQIRRRKHHPGAEERMPHAPVGHNESRR